MIHAKRGVALLALTLLVTTLVYYKTVTSSLTVRSLRAKVPQVIGLGDYFDAEEGQYGFAKPQGSPSSAKADSDTKPEVDKLNPTISPTNLPPQKEYSRNLVMARMKKDNFTWLDEVDLGPFPPARITYIADDLSAKYHPPVNKGHEVMTYLTYIIDFYDNLPDVTIFMHSHRYAWHNDDLLNYDAAEMIKRLSTERVLREGYMNLRCHWMPGCPEWIHPGQVEPDREKLEQSMIADAWAELFPGKPIPHVLAQPCCSQFALSRDRIRQISKEEYEHYRSWLRKSPIRDTMSGRIFEYIWQVIFTDDAVFCPNQRSCYCDGFGVCFDDEASFDKWFELRYQKKLHEQSLREWEEKAKKIEAFRIVDSKGTTDSSAWRWKEGLEIGDIEIPEIGKDEELKTLIRELDADLEYRRLNALQRGTDPQIRAQSAGRIWKEGDGF